MGIKNDLKHVSKTLQLLESDSFCRRFSSLLVMAFRQLFFDTPELPKIVLPKAFIFGKTPFGHLHITYVSCKGLSFDNNAIHTGFHANRI